MPVHFGAPAFTAAVGVSTTNQETTDGVKVEVERNWRRGIALPLVIVAVIIVLDQTAKWLVTRSLGPGQPQHRRDLLGTIVAIDYVQNTGAAFGLLRGQTGILTVIALVVLLGLIISYRQVPNPSLFLSVGLGLLLGGALGNLVDRFRLGYVVDFAAVSVWPKFNVADASITIGVALLAVQFWRGEAQGERAASGTPTQEPLWDGDK